MIPIAILAAASHDRSTVPKLVYSDLRISRTKGHLGIRKKKFKKNEFE